jgi:hypothetical protein
MTGDLFTSEPFSTRFDGPCNFFEGIIDRIRETSFRLILIHAISDVPELFDDNILRDLLLKLIELGLHNANRGRRAAVKRSADRPEDSDPNRVVQVFTDVGAPTEPLRKKTRQRGGHSGRNKTADEYEATAYAVLSTIQGLFEERDDIVRQLRNGNIVKGLIEMGMAVRRDSPVLPSVCRWVAEIIKGDPERNPTVPEDITEVLSEYKGIEFKDMCLKKKQALFQMLGGDHEGLLLNLRAAFLEDPPVNDVFNSVYLEVIKSMDDDRLQWFLRCDEEIFVRTLVWKVAQSFRAPDSPTYTAFNGHLFELTKFLLSKEVLTPCMNDDFWLAFAEEFRSRVIQLEEEYRRQDDY